MIRTARPTCVRVAAASLLMAWITSSALGQATIRPATTADLARAYQRFDRTMRTAQPNGPTIRTMNARFDQVTRLFLSERYDRAAQSLDAMTVELIRKNPGRSLAEDLLALRATIKPEIWVRDSGDAVGLEIAGIRAIDVGHRDMRLELAAPGAAGIWKTDLEALPLRRDLTEVLIGAPSARYELSVTMPGSEAVSLGAITVFDQPLDKLRRQLEDRLESIDPSNEHLARDVEICADRIALLSVDPNAASIGALMRNLPQLADALDAEVAQLEAGRSPYAARTGDDARHLRSNGLTIPLRLFVPAIVEEEPAVPRPLLIALHGASVDENMFFDGYGAGLIKDLAEERGVIVAAPLTYGFAGSPQHLDALVRDLSRHYAIDRSRIYVLGHSLGAIGALSLADWRSRALAASCCIAGFRPLGVVEVMCPTRIYIAEHDYTFFQPDRILPIINAAIEAGLPLEPIVLPDQGHTLIVSSVLPDAIDWLLEHRAAIVEPPLGE